MGIFRTTVAAKLNRVKPVQRVIGCDNLYWGKNWSPIAWQSAFFDSLTDMFHHCAAIIKKIFWLNKKMLRLQSQINKPRQHGSKILSLRRSYNNLLKGGKNQNERNQTLPWTHGNLQAKARQQSIQKLIDLLTQIGYKYLQNAENPNNSSYKNELKTLELRYKKLSKTNRLPWTSENKDQKIKKLIDLLREIGYKYLQIAENPHNNSSETQQLRRLEREYKSLDPYSGGRKREKSSRRRRKIIK